MAQTYLSLTRKTAAANCRILFANGFRPAAQKALVAKLVRAGYDTTDALAT